MRNFIALTLIGAIIFALPMNVHAADPNQRRSEILEKFDADGDGKLSADERQAAREAGARSGKGRRGEKRRQEILEEFDLDGDGQLNDSERQAARESGKFGRRGKRSN